MDSAALDFDELLAQCDLLLEKRLQKIVVLDEFEKFLEDFAFGFVVDALCSSVVAVCHERLARCALQDCRPRANCV